MRGNQLVILATLVIILCSGFLLWDHVHARAQAITAAAAQAK
jgi:hypothetical protein